MKLNSQELYKYTPSDPIYKKIFKKYVSPIYKKMSQFLRCSYCLKDLSTPYSTFVFLILVGVFNVSHILWGYICKNIQKVTLINDSIGFDVFWFFFL